MTRRNTAWQVYHAQWAGQNGEGAVRVAQRTNAISNPSILCAMGGIASKLRVKSQFLCYSSTKVQNNNFRSD